MRDFCVNNVFWNVFFVKPNDGILRKSDGTYTLGVTDNNLKTVFVSDTLYGDLLQKVITHEITHIFCFEYGISLDIATEELLADFIATYGRNVIDVADNLLMILKEVA